MKGALPLAAVVLAVGAQPALAAFPGTNGPIAFELTGPPSTILQAVNADGTGATKDLVAIGPEDRDAAWAPDGRRLAFTSTRDGNEEIYVLDVDSGTQTRVTVNPARDHDPTWSPDGTRLAFASNRDGNPELYVMPASGGPARRLTFDPAADRQPAWSPGRAIAFASDRGGNQDIYAVDEDGGALTRVTQDAGAEADPSWAPGGTRLAYTEEEAGAFRVFAVDIDGANPVEIAPGHFPSWSPDGSLIALATNSIPGQILVAQATGPSAGMPPGARLLGVTGTDPNWGPLPAPVGPPVAGRTLTVTPAGSRVLVAPGTAEPPSTDPGLQARLRTPAELHFGSTIDASAGTVQIEAVTTTPDGPGTVGRAVVSGGVFRVSQIGAGDPTLRLLPGVRPCQPARAARYPPEARMRIRARGRFRTVGGYGRGAGRGTEWVIRERCDGTIFRVFEGIVDVHDYRRKLTLRVRAGRCYLASVRRRPGALKPKRKCPRARARR